QAVGRLLGGEDCPSGTLKPSGREAKSPDLTGKAVTHGYSAHAASTPTTRGVGFRSASVGKAIGRQRNGKHGWRRGRHGVWGAGQSHERARLRGLQLMLQIALRRRIEQAERYVVPARAARARLLTRSPRRPARANGLGW